MKWVIPIPSKRNAIQRLAEPVSPAVVLRKLRQSAKLWRIVAPDVARGVVCAWRGRGASDDVNVERRRSSAEYRYRHVRRTSGHFAALAIRFVSR